MDDNTLNRLIGDHFAEHGETSARLLARFTAVFYSGMEAQGVPSDVRKVCAQEYVRSMVDGSTRIAIALQRLKGQ